LRFRSYKNYKEELINILIAKKLSNGIIKDDELGVSYRNNNVLDTAETLLLKSYKPEMTSDKISNILIPSINLAKLYLISKDYKKLNYYLTIADSLIIKDIGTYHYLELLNIKIDYYSILNDKDKIIKNLLIYNEINKSLDDKFNKINFERIFLKQIDYNNKNNKKYNSITLVLVLLFTIVLFIIILIFLKKINNKSIENNQIFSELSDIKLKYINSINHISELQNRELETIKTLNRIENTLKHNPSYTSIRPILSEINNLKKFEDNWSLFKSTFTNQFPNFYKNLLEQCNDLTELDLKHATFIKLNMNTKEVAQLLNINPQSVTTFRLRLKNKLNLLDNEKLKSFIYKL